MNPTTTFAALANGYTYESSGFYAVTPCRVADTRDPISPSGGPALAANAVRTFRPVRSALGQHALLLRRLRLLPVKEQN